MTFTTNDLPLAATLTLYGFEIKSITPRPDRPAFANFEFLDVPEDFLNDFDMDILRVEPKTFALKIRNLTGLAQRVCRLT